MKTIILLSILLSFAFSSSAQPTQEQFNTLQKENQEIKARLLEIEKRLAIVEGKSASSPSKSAKWDSLIERIVVALERFHKEPQQYVNARQFSDFDKEQSRLMTLLQDQEAKAKELISELKAEGFGKTDDILRELNEFLSHSRLNIAQSALFFVTAVTNGLEDEETKKRGKEREEMQKQAFRRILNIRDFKSK